MLIKNNPKYVSDVQESNISIGVLVKIYIYELGLRKIFSFYLIIINKNSSKFLCLEER